jgi:hypothetical protein
MPGNDRVRYCPECKLNVYNFSALSAREIDRLVPETRRTIVRALLSASRRHHARAKLPWHCSRHAALDFSCRRGGDGRPRQRQPGFRETFSATSELLADTDPSCEKVCLWYSSILPVREFLIRKLRSARRPTRTNSPRKQTMQAKPSSPTCPKAPLLINSRQARSPVHGV